MASMAVEAPPPLSAANEPPRNAIPAFRYTDAGWLARERDEVFGRAWLVVGAAYRVATPGSYFTFDELGHSIAIVRDRDGTLRAFHNSCRHRGTRLLEHAGTLRAIRCPYHDWKYSLDGRLRHVPGQDGFACGLDKDRMGLRAVRVEEAIGLIWVCFSDDGPPLSETLAAIPEEVAAYRLEEMYPVQEVTWRAPCNWKAVLDNATEAYHLEAVHGHSVNPLIDEQPEFVTHGDHVRLSLAISNYGWRRWIDRHTSRGGPYTKRQRDALQKYVLFPNSLINLVPCHLTLFQAWPIDSNTCRFFYGFYGRRGAKPLEWLRVRATWLLSRYILREDWRILELFQRGVATRPDSEQPLHVNERAIAHFHRTLDRWIAP